VCGRENPPKVVRWRLEPHNICVALTLGIAFSFAIVAVAVYSSRWILSASRRVDRDFSMVASQSGHAKSLSIAGTR